MKCKKVSRATRYAAAALLLAVSIGAVSSTFVLAAPDREHAGSNDVFTDGFFEEVLSIAPFMNSEAVLSGDSAEDLIRYLKGLRLEPAETADPFDARQDVRFGGNQGFEVSYRDGNHVHFSASGSLLTVGTENYYVLNDDGTKAADFDETLWSFFHPDEGWDK